MDILNFISWIRGRRQVTSVDPTKTLIPVGLKDGRRDDEYLAGAISVEDLAAQIAPQPYKVYTALLTQSGGDDFQSISSGSLTIGVTYQIISASGDPGDFTNVGAPNNNLGTYFVATGTDPNEWGAYELEYNEGAPVVTVLENTIGNIWFTYDSIGYYEIQLSNPIDVDKTFLYIGNGPTVGGTIFYEESAFKTISFPGSSGTASTLILFTSVDGFGSGFTDGRLNKTPIEIRVYN